jgi:ubiquinone/menaquinone biosynthesis C-methylase UbiE
LAYNMKDSITYKDIRRYWEDRAKNSPNSLQATTNDYFMREIEIRKLSEELLKISKDIKNVADLGCGDGLSTLSIAKNFPSIMFKGFDYSPSMIKIAKNRQQQWGISNVDFEEHDIIKDKIDNSYNVMYTTRCLINLPSRLMQEEAIREIHCNLESDGVYIMIENFIDGHELFNNLRRDFDLPEIMVRDHNLYFDEKQLYDFVNNLFVIEKIENISSLYYVVSRIIYAKICKINNSVPDYFDIHHELASKLPMMGNYGPIKMLVMRKKL